MTSEPSIERRERLLFVHLPERCRSLSWAIVGGGFHETRAVAWWQVNGADLEPPADPATLMRERLATHGLHGAVGFLTSRRLDRFVDLREHGETVGVSVVATVGLSNGLAVGDPWTYRGPGAVPEAGTINIHCHLDRAVSDLALVEAVALVSEARTTALLDEPVLSPLSSLPMTGTGTDCIAVTCPIREPAEPYVGKHGEIGSLIGRAVRRAIGEGFRQWREDRNRKALLESSI